MAEYRQVLGETFPVYFKDYTDYTWIKNPFADTLRNEAQKSNSQRFGQLNFGQRQEGAVLSKFLLAFSTTYSRESEYSVMVPIKNQFRTKIIIEPNPKLKTMLCRTLVDPLYRSLLSNLHRHLPHSLAGI